MPTYNHYVDRSPVYVPEVGDTVEYQCYQRGRVSLPVTMTKDEGGYTEIWLGDGIIPAPLFNVNHATGNANTGVWKLVTKAADNNKTSPLAYSDAEENIASELFTLLNESYGSAQLGFLGATAVVHKTIDAIRENAKDG